MAIFVDTKKQPIVSDEQLRLRNRFKRKLTCLESPFFSFPILKDLKSLGQHDNCWRRFRKIARGKYYVILHCKRWEFWTSRRWTWRCDYRPQLWGLLGHYNSPKNRLQLVKLHIRYWRLCRVHSPNHLCLGDGLERKISWFLLSFKNFLEKAFRPGNDQDRFEMDISF